MLEDSMHGKIPHFVACSVTQGLQKQLELP
jgi:hypothetical protein